MRAALSAGVLLGVGLLLLGPKEMIAQNTGQVRRAQPVEETPVPRALPADQPSNGTSQGQGLGAEPPGPAPQETAPPAQRQLEYADALFGRKLYDLAVPEFEKYLEEYPNAPGRANAFFFLGECYRALNKPGLARKN